MRLQEVLVFLVLAGWDLVSDSLLVLLPESLLFVLLDALVMPLDTPFASEKTRAP